MPSVFIDPPSMHYLKDRLFDVSDPHLNRDNALTPYLRLKAILNDGGVGIKTVDYLFHGENVSDINDYYSLGILENYERLKGANKVHLRGFLLFEPPVVCPELYQSLPSLTASFERVYVHNTIGDGYSLQGVDQSRLRKLFWPQPFKGVLEQYWANGDRLNRVVVINGNHKPQSHAGELYSKRIEAMAALAKVEAVDLYGTGWDKWWTRRSFWLPYWRNRSVLMSINRGACASKYETLSRYRFCLCFENMQMTGFVTEKIFDCLYAGTVPLYWGAPDITSLIPPETYIDCRKFASWEEMWQEISSMSEDRINTLREAGRAFLDSPDFLRYYDFLPNEIGSLLSANYSSAGFVHN